MILTKMKLKWGGASKMKVDINQKNAVSAAMHPPEM